MKFPFWYIGEKVFYKPDDFDLNKEAQKLLFDKNIRYGSDNFFIIQGNIGLLKMTSRIKFKIDTDGVTIQVNYYLSLFESNIFLLLGIVLGVFFSIMDKANFSFIALFLGLTAYILNSVALSHYMKNTIRHFGNLAETIEQQTLWLKQQEWIKDKNRCSACGEPINQYAIKCVNCDMHYKDKTPMRSIPLSNTNYS